MYGQLAHHDGVIDGDRSFNQRIVTFLVRATKVLETVWTGRPGTDTGVSRQFRGVFWPPLAIQIISGRIQPQSNLPKHGSDRTGIGLGTHTNNAIVIVR